MKIGFDARKINREIRTGIEEYSYHLLKNLLEIDSRNEYILYSDSPIVERVGSELNLSRAINITIPFPRSPVPWVTLALPLQLLRSTAQPQVLFMPVHYVPPICQSRIVFTAYDTVFEHFGGVTRLVHAVLLRTAIWRSQKILSISCATRDDLVRHLGVDPRKIAVTLLGYDDRIFHQLYSLAEKQDVVNKYNLQAGYILSCGTLQPRKNIVRLIKAYSLLVKRHRIPQQLVIVGKRGWGFEDIYRIVQELQVEERVTFTGYLPARELALLMNSATLFAFPSLYEGFGIPLLEAMACGTPIVTSNVSSMPEVAADAAVLVDPYSVEQLSDGIGQVLDDQELQMEMREKGLRRVEQFSWLKTAEETLKVLEKVGED